MLIIASPSPRTTNCPRMGRGQVMWPLKTFWAPIISRTAEPKVVKFCTQVCYINSSNRMRYHPQKRRGYGHETIMHAARHAGLSATAELVIWQQCRTKFHLFVKVETNWTCSIGFDFVEFRFDFVQRTKFHKKTRSTLFPKTATLLPKAATKSKQHSILS